MSNQNQRLDDVLSAIDAGFDASVDRLSDILRIPSISTDPAHDDDVSFSAPIATAAPATRTDNLLGG